MKLFRKVQVNRVSEDIELEDIENIIRMYPDTILLDVRNIGEYKEGHLKNAINIPLYDLKQKANHILLNKNATIIVYCEVGIRSKKAMKILKSLGYKNLYHLKNGIG